MSYALARLGPSRLEHSAYRMSSLFPSSSNPTAKFPGPVLGSDFPVEPPNPFQGMYAAVTRLSPHTGKSPSGDKGWYSAQSLSVGQALQGFTRNAAYGWFKENRTGAIEVGKWADWIVVDRDIFKDETGIWEDPSGEGLRDVVVLETWVAGRRVYERPVPEKAGNDWVGRTIDWIGDAFILVSGWFSESEKAQEL